MRFELRIKFDRLQNHQRVSSATGEELTKGDV